MSYMDMVTLYNQSNILEVIAAMWTDILGGRWSSKKKKGGGHSSEIFLKNVKLYTVAHLSLYLPGIFI